MIEKRRCPNCGAYLSETDTSCYVCGEVIDELPNVKPRDIKPNAKTYAPVYYEPEEQNDYVMPSDKAAEPRHAQPEPRYSQPEPNYAKPEPRNSQPEKAEQTEQPVKAQQKYDDDNYDDVASTFGEDGFDIYRDYEDDDDSYEEKKGVKKVLLICGIIVGVVGIGALVFGLLFSRGLFGGGDKKEGLTIYFDKPSVNLNLMDSNGTVYNWGADVSVGYLKDGKEQKQNLSPMVDYDNLWECTLPEDATAVYFYQNSSSKIRTELVSTLADENVYYVTDILFNSNNRLPIAAANIDNFDNLGVNAAETTAPATEATTATASQETTAPDSTAESTEATTEPESSTAPSGDAYSVSTPSSWQKGATVVKKDNCTTYYETYNYKNYGSGMLLSIYVFDKGDNSYGDLHAKKVLTASDGRKIVIVTPTDIEFDDSDETAQEKYIALSNSTNQVISSVSAG